jgi:uncharacterized protein (DUF2147 family)
LKLFLNPNPPFKRSILSTLIYALIIYSLFTAGVLAQHVESDSMLGSWNNEEHDASIEIYRCGEKYCGRITWIKEPTYPTNDKNRKDGQPRTDDNNPDPKLRNRPIIGLTIMKDFIYAGKNIWEGGTVYDPKNGKTYKGKMTLISHNQMKLRGFVIFSLFGRTTVWTRIDS